MNDEEYKKINAVLESFPDSEAYQKMYRDSSIFHKIVMMLARGMTHQEVILRLVECTEDTHKALEHLLLTQPPKPIVFEFKKVKPT